MHLTLEALARIQSSARTHLTFSLTLACPLRCAHCIVDAAPEKKSTTMPVETAEAYAAQMPALWEGGIRALSFTGGEPLLAREQLRVLSNAGHAVGMHAGVVTAAHWANTEETAHKIVAAYPGIMTWDLSVDAYHEEFVKLENVRNAYVAAKALGRRAIIRMTHHESLTADERRILRYFEESCPDAEFCYQKIRRVGRGNDLGIPLSDNYNPWTKPCLTQGMVVRYDGTISPCCMNLVEERRHPFQLGDARSRPLRVIHEEYMSLSLLQMLRVIGFVEVMRWLDEANLLDELPDPLPDDVCDLCHLLCSNERLSSYLAERAAKPENRLRIAVLASRVLGESGMLERVLRENADRKDELEGYDLAESLARQAMPEASKEAL